MGRAREAVALAGIIAVILLSMSGCPAKKVRPPLSPPSPGPSPAAPRPVCGLAAERSAIEEGQSVTLRWTSSDATALDLQPGIGKVQLEGSIAVTPTDSTVYTIYATGPGGYFTCIARVTVIPLATGPPPPPPSATPVFPWPPPKWTLKYQIPDVLVLGSPDKRASMGEALNRIKHAMGQAGIDQWSVYPINAAGEEHGFVVVSRPENIGDDGRWKSPRFCIEDCRLEEFQLGTILNALFSANAGRYRVIALVVTDLPIQPGSAPPTPAEMERIVTQGPSNLPPQLAATTVKPTVICEALIYEFYRPNPGAAPQSVDPSSLTAIQHLTGAGLWSKEELQR